MQLASTTVPAPRRGFVIVATVLAACETDDPDQLYVVVPDAADLAAAGDAADGLACPDGVTTWRDALAYWDDRRCTAFARCFPDTYAEWYGDQAECVAQLGGLHCRGGTPGWCDQPFPRERCATLLACTVDTETVACDHDAVVPASCEDALR